MQPEVAREFFSQYLPADIRKKVDLTTLVPQKESFIDDKLRMQIADLLFSVDFEGEPGYLYILMEHASTPDKMLPLRMLKYVISAMEHHCTQTGESKLPLVYPLIFYTGQEPYTHSTNIYDLFENDKKLAQDIYSKPYKLVDLSQVSDEELKQYHWLSLLGLTMKYIRESDFLPILQDMLYLLKRVESEGGSEYIYRTMTYIAEAGEVQDPDKFDETLRQGLVDQEETIMTMAEHWKQEGRQQGIEQGVIQGVKLAAIKLLKNGLSVEQVANGIDLSLDEVEDLRKQNFS